MIRRSGNSNGSASGTGGARINLGKRIDEDIRYYLQHERTPGSFTPANFIDIVPSTRSRQTGPMPIAYDDTEDALNYTISDMFRETEAEVIVNANPSTADFRSFLITRKPSFYIDGMRGRAQPALSDGYFGIQVMIDYGTWVFARVISRHNVFPDLNVNRVAQMYESVFTKSLNAVKAGKILSGNDFQNMVDRWVELDSITFKLGPSPVDYLRLDNL